MGLEYKVPVTKPLPRKELKEIEEWFQRRDVGYIIVKTKDGRYVLWRELMLGDEHYDIVRKQPAKSHWVYEFRPEK